MQPGCLPVGSYYAQFESCEPFVENTDKYGPAVVLRWKILGGPCDGAVATRVCSAKMTPGSSLGKLAVSIAGRQIAVGEAFSFGQYVGCRGNLLIEGTNNGSRVAGFYREPQLPTQAYSQASGNGQVEQSVQTPTTVERF
jgi:hypothetical protein